MLKFAITTAFAVGTLSAPTAAGANMSSPAPSAVESQDWKARGVNGGNVNFVAYQGGRFILRNDGSWTEFAGRGRVFSFREDRRDDWSVYLIDEDREGDPRKMEVQLNLHTGQVLWNEFGQPKQILYPITRARARHDWKRAH